VKSFLNFWLIVFVYLSSVSAFAQSDTVREARLRAEVEPGIVVGDAQTLTTTDGRKFFAIFTEGKQKQVAFVLAHGVGVHPDYGWIGQLRVLLADAGYATLSIQMPVRSRETTSGDDYVSTFPDATSRLTAAHEWLHERGYAKVILASHSMGSWMANVYFQQTPHAPYVAWVAMGVTGRILPLKENSLPVLDLYGENDVPACLSKAWLRRAHLMLLPQSQQVMVAHADHHYSGVEKEASQAIIDFTRARFPVTNAGQK
jgi:hypothetical protein